MLPLHLRPAKHKDVSLCPFLFSNGVILHNGQELNGKLNSLNISVSISASDFIAVSLKTLCLLVFEWSWFVFNERETKPTWLKQWAFTHIVANPTYPSLVTLLPSRKKILHYSSSRSQTLLQLPPSRETDHNTISHTRTEINHINYEHEQPHPQKLTQIQNCTNNQI